MKQAFIQGAMILAIAGLINKILGFVYRIALSRIIGGEGMGLFQMTYPTLLFIITLVTAGLPVAISKLVAEAESNKDYKKIKKILSYSYIIVVLTSVTFIGLLIIFAPFISETLLTDSRVIYTLYAMLPIIPIVAISSIYRGYFQGKQNMIPTATSQILEQTVRIFTVITLAYILLPYGIEYASAGAMFGMFLGEMMGMLLLIIYYNRLKKADNQQSVAKKLSPKKILGEIGNIAIPVTISRIIGSLAYAVEPFLVSHSLAIAGLTVASATTLYGQLEGMAIPLIYFPTVLTYSLSLSLIPNISEALAQNKWNLIHLRLHQSLRLAMIVGFPATVFLFVLAEPLTIVLYNSREVATYLKIMAPFAIFLYFQGPLQATLQAMNKAKLAMNNSIFASIVKTITIPLLVSQPIFGINGLAIAINVGVFLATLLHFIDVIKITGYSFEVKPFLKITGSALLLGYLSYYLSGSYFTNYPLFLNLIFTVTLSSFSYLIFLFWLRVIDISDFARIPWIGSALKKWFI